MTDYYSDDDILPVSDPTENTYAELYNTPIPYPPRKLPPILKMQDIFKVGLQSQVNKLLGKGE